MLKIVDGEEVEMTADEVAAWNASLPPDLPSVPESVSSRQFKLQLLAAGIIDQVDAWVKQQPRDIQIAYEYSGTFVRSSPMMTEGFTAKGFTEEQIDDFFTAASKL